MERGTAGLSLCIRELLPGAGSGVGVQVAGLVLDEVWYRGRSTLCLLAWVVRGDGGSVRLSSSIG